MKVLLFGGTTEGRARAALLRAQGHEVLVSVASEAGRMELPEDMPCHAGRLDAPGMCALARSFGAERLVDATHPFAVSAHENIRLCAEALSLPLERVVRPSDREADFSDRVSWVRDAEEAARTLLETTGNVLLTTGGNTLGVYASIVDPARLYARVLPVEASLGKCAEAGLHISHVIAMQGPFSQAFNRALYEQWNIAVLVTKDSGDAGGVRDKVLPALALGIRVIMIGRPDREA